MKEFQKIVDFVRDMYQEPKAFIPLHAPSFTGNEKKYVTECIETTFVSSVGKFVNQFEEVTANYVGSKYAVAVVNGTAALHIALLMVDVKPGDEVITQPLTFVATANAISHASAIPVFVDVDRDTMGMSPAKLSAWLQENAAIKGKGNNRKAVNQSTGRRISAIVPMHTFGHPCRIQEIVDVADGYSIPVIEDSAESLGSFSNTKHTGTFGKIGVFSYNGNKTITTGGGGMIVTDDEVLAKRAKHVTTTAKIPHPYEYVHDEIGYNYRLTNINAALGVAQMENLEGILSNKRQTARKYQKFFNDAEIEFMTEPEGCKSNYWLNTIVMPSRKERDEFLKFSNTKGVMVRPAWTLMNKLEMFKRTTVGSLSNAEWLADRLVNIPSSVINS